MNNKKFNQDFKKTIVDLYYSGRSVKELSSEYGVSDVTIYKWIKRFSPISTSDGKTTTLNDVAELKKQIARLQEENNYLKKGYHHIRQSINDDQLFKVITEQSDKHSIQAMCKILEVSRSSYYNALCHTPSNRELENKELKETIYNIYTQSKRRYGAPKIYHMLLKKGYTVSIKRVQRIMRKLGIYAITVKKYRPYSTKQKVIEYPNLLNRDFQTTALNQKWVTDITYIHTIKDGWCYLASVMDLHSRKIIGYSFDTAMTVNIALQAVKNAYISQNPTDTLVLHSDLGSQYTSMEFGRYLKSKGIQHSFSRKGCPYDNVTIESFHSVLKKEEIHHVKYIDFYTAKLAIFEYIESWYNRSRIHGSLKYKTPQQVEDEAKIVC
ncbi:IS3 family transposase [Crassaminicella indica]|uniref:IS3 family transposase n=1 Tax=Crassaminicella indica TaxID=2855394 RepID=A0ABX8R7Y1_9CLOT|nr:IS3 family transposase [Crassaminicella indica]QXM05129.1 IS3 family transposase [Crassaminicella indica]